MHPDLELAAWRFLAKRRTGSLAVAHIEFIDGDTPESKSSIVTPSEEQGVYESASGATFGEAAVALAIRLGMSC